MAHRRGISKQGESSDDEKQGEGVLNHFGAWSKMYDSLREIVVSIVEISHSC